MILCRVVHSITSTDGDQPRLRVWLLALVLLAAIGSISLVGAESAAAEDETDAADEGLVEVQETEGGADPEVEPEWLDRAQREIAASEYHVTWQEDTSLPGRRPAWHAPNRVQGFRAYFTESGFELEPRVDSGAEWSWGLHLLGIGRGQDRLAASEASLAAEGARITYDRGSVTEWLVNGPRGLKHGLTLLAPPERADGEQKSTRLEIDFRMSGTVTAVLAEDGQSIDFLTADGARVLRYAELLVTDAAGRVLPSRMELARDGGTPILRLALDDRGAVYPLEVDPLATSPSWTTESNQVSAWYGWSVATAGDVNGDGYADVAIGSRFFDNGETDEGRVFVYHGSASGPSVVASWTAESDLGSADFAFDVATAGDVNGDGYSDLIVGAPLLDNAEADEGRVYVYHGSASGLPASANWTAEPDVAGAQFGFSVAPAGDVNGDGFADVVIGARLYANVETGEGAAFVYHGSGAGLSASADWSAESDQADAQFGYSVSTAGDVNGDGYTDVVVGARFYDNGETDEGRVYAYHGSASGLSATASWTVESDDADARQGNSVAAAGDVDGDGYADVIVGAPLFTGPVENEGRATVYRGSAGGLSATADWTLLGGLINGQVGHTVAGAGDVDGDGYADVIVGQGLFGDSEAMVFLGSPTGLSTSADWTVNGPQNLARFAWVVATAGDVNGDGYSDVIVGSHLHDNGEPDEGRAYLYLGSASGLAAASGWTAESDQDLAEFGWSVSTAGDVNGDGFGDVIVGAHLFDNGQANEGRAYVFHGSGAGLGATASWTAESDQADAEFAKSVSTAGDVNGDGYADVIVGAHLYDNVESNEGRAYVYTGSAAGLSAGASWTAESDQADAGLGAAVATAGDVNGDGFSDVVVGAPEFDNGFTDEGAAFVYLGSGAGLSAAADWSAEGGRASGGFGAAVGTAGDIDADTYSDLIVGAPLYDAPQTDKGRAFLYRGSSLGLGATASAFFQNGQAGSQFGASVSTAGDVNGDGFADWMIGSPFFDGGEMDEGRIYVYHGSASGPDTGVDWSAESDQIGAQLGGSVALAGDVNGDGFADVIAGASLFDNGQSDEGRAFVFHGSGTGLAGTPSWTAEGEQDGAAFGSAVGSAGDVNGDGYADVLVGANLYDNVEPDEGGSFLYFGNDGTGLTLSPEQRRSDDAAPVAPLGRSDCADCFRLAALGRTPYGRGLVKLEWEVEPLGTPFDGLGTDVGGSWLDSGTAGVAISQLVTGLDEGASYHWRVRLLYHPATTPFQQASRWFTVPRNGIEEADLLMAGCRDADGDGFGTFGDPSCPGGATIDCDDTNPNCTSDCTDADADGFCVTSDCDESNANCRADCTDSDADGYCVGVDCDDSTADCLLDCTDVDEDGLSVCAGDCDDANANCSTDCTDLDADGFCVVEDCDESNPNCRADCSDADGDGLCVGVDCDDSNPFCTTDCTDADADGYCITSDCDEGNPFCADDCTDVDGDGYCTGIDCDTGNPNCNAVCTDADEDGLAACANDCNDANGNCTTDCTDADGDGWCITTDCDDDPVTGPFCNADCTDADSDGYCVTDDCDETRPNCTADCTDGDGDGIPLCGGDCDDGNPFCTFTCADSDSDGYCGLNDCDDMNATCADDCTDGDGDGFCAAADCDDANPFCNTDCSDPDGDGFCVNTDCDEGNPQCNADCTDADFDQFCLGVDCDDSNPNCDANCVDNDLDGLFLCAGDCDDSNPNCLTDCTDADGDGWCVETDCDDGNFQCNSDCNDIDGDGFCGTIDCDDFRATCNLDCSDTDGDGLRVCEGDCDDFNPNCGFICLDGDSDGYCVGLDCDDSKPNCTTDCSDVDQDGYCGSFDCDDGDADCNVDCIDDDGDLLSECDGDCDDTNPNCTIDCTDDDGDGFCVDSDLDDANPNCSTDLTDADGDGYCLPEDCDDTKPNCATECTDADSDGFCAPQDCDESNAACNTDCADADADGLAECEGDCFDGSASCTDTCVDADGDGLPVCAGDCDDSNAGCALDCTDVDADGFCLGVDCDDAVAACTVTCDDADGDGTRACDGDVDDGNPNCTTDPTDADGDGWCAGIDCDETVSTCNVDCVDGDGDGTRACDGDCDDTIAACASECTDGDGDGVWVCAGDVDDTNANCTTDPTDADNDDYCDNIDCDSTNSACTDNCADSDADGVRVCDGDVDDSNPNCTIDNTDADSDGWCAPFDCNEASTGCNDPALCTDDDGDGLAECQGDCDDTSPNCVFICDDADQDGYCVGFDCDETSPGCNDNCDDGDGDGVRVCDGDCDDANPHCVGDCTDTDGDGWCEGLDCDDANANCRGICDDADADGFCVTVDCNDASSFCTDDCTDADGDGYCGVTDCDDANANCNASCTDADADGYCGAADCDDAVMECNVDCADVDADGTRACAGDCDDTNANCDAICRDEDMDGLYLCAGDCDDQNPNCSTDCTDIDADGWCVVEDCDDAVASCNISCFDTDGDGVAVCAGDCDPINPNCTFDCTDLDGDDWCVGNDCDDANPFCRSSCVDGDGDGVCLPIDRDDLNPNCTTNITDVDMDGYCVTSDCNDTNANCNENCTDADADGFCITTDCDDANGNCSTDCTDGDGDGFCVTNDCNDTIAACVVDCSDADGDGTPSCNGFDCDDGNAFCAFNCDDVDGDGFCLDRDCDDSNPTCTSDCTDLDGDGVCGTADCDDLVPGCDFDCTDLDGDGLDACAGDCDESNPNCGLDCTDADGDGYCPPLDCDDGDPLIHPDAAESCADGADNDCDTLVDGDDPGCTGLAVDGLNFVAGDKTALVWNPAIAADAYAVYRGSIPAGGMQGYDHLCYATELSSTGAIDTQTPRKGEALYYLVTGLEIGTGFLRPMAAGPLGEGNGGTSRPDSDSVTCGPRIYVDPDNTGGATGLNWSAAYTNFSRAIDHARSVGRGMEIWARGTVIDEAEDPSTLSGSSSRPAVRILGGFSGTETLQWQRQPATQTTTWEGNTTQPLLSSTHADVVLDGITLRDATSALISTSAGDRIELTDVVVEQMSSHAVDLTIDDAAGGTLVMQGGTYDASGPGAVRAVGQLGTLDGQIRGNTFAGGSDAAMRLEARAQGGDSEVSLEIERNTVSGGAIGLVLGAHVNDEAVDASQSSFVASNLFHGTSSDAVVVEATGTFAAAAGAASARAEPLLVGNTISDGGDAGVACVAARTDSTGSPASHQVRCEPGLWDNLITFHTGAGVEESADDEATNLVSDPRVVGNSLFGNGSLYHDEGVTPLNLAQVNGLAGAADNYEADPLYVDRPADDYHLRGPQVMIEFGSSMRYLDNAIDPGIGMTWTDPVFDDLSWTAGLYGVGYETAAGNDPGAHSLILTSVPSTGTLSIFTRSEFTIANLSDVGTLAIGADYDDGYVVFVNGTEVFRSASMPGGALDWDTSSGLHESSNGTQPVYELQDISTAGVPALVQGTNVLAIGVWNANLGSSDLVVVPKLIVNRNPALDVGHPDAPRLAIEDLDGQDRVGDGDDDGVALPDTGALER